MGDVTAEKLIKARELMQDVEYNKKDFPMCMWFNGKQFTREYKGEWELVEDDN